MNLLVKPSSNLKAFVCTSLNQSDRPKTRCVKCTPMCASARVAPSNIVYQRYGYRSTGTGVLTTKVLLLR